MLLFHCVPTRQTRTLTVTSTRSTAATWAGFAFAYYGTIITVTLVFSTQDDSHQGGDGVFDFDYGAIFASASAEVAGTTFVLLAMIIIRWEF